MKRDDSVFFFTLVDFLITALFFGVVLYALAMRANAAEAKEIQTNEEALERLMNAAGVASLVELTDAFSRLGPVKELQPIVSVIRQAGGGPALVKLQSVIREAGGIDSVVAIVARARREEGYGKPPCLFTLAANGRKVTRDVASVVATDSTIFFSSLTPALDTLLRKLKIDYASIDTLSLLEFRRTFARLPAAQPECRYSIGFRERTRYVDARDAAGAGFRLSHVRP